jgi:hypothetical protein
MLSPAAKPERVETREATEQRATTASAAALGAATGDTRSSYGDGWKRCAGLREPTGQQQRRGATFAARTVTFLVARGCTRRDTSRALARISGGGAGELAGTGGGQQKQCHSFVVPRGAGATFARAKRAAPRQTPAANGVTAHGRGERT